MTADKNIRPATYELLPVMELSIKPDTKGSERPFSESLLVHNSSWFCQFRWLVIATLAFYGIVGLFPRLIGSFGMRPPGTWPFITAALPAHGPLSRRGFWYSAILLFCIRLERGPHPSR